MAPATVRWLEEESNVSDPVTLARAARESLAQGLNALQADPSVPPHLVELAAPIAQAMGALHRIESSRGTQLAGNAETAMTSVQTALASLQAQPPTVPAVVTAMEAVAGALGNLHLLTKAAQPAAQAAAPAPAPAPAPAAPPRAATVTSPMKQQPEPQPQYAAAPAPQQYAAPPQPQYQQPPQQQYAAPPQPQYAAPPPQAQYAAAPQYAQPPPPQQPYAQVAVDPFRPQTSSEPVAAELGAHSPSNFYKGLSGNDIVDHGGLFVSTYKLPKLGAPVRLRVSLPGGYEFEANAVVRWRREANETATDAPPGFGAQFTEITPEARQLVYRYVRNREPMFHDDL
jgi:PilZ domain